MSNNKNVLKNKHLDEVTYLRGLAIIAVVAIHTIYVNKSLGFEFTNLLYMAIIQISAYSVPFFVFISGLVLTYTYKDRNINYLEFEKKRFNTILIPYLVWSIIYLFYNINLQNNNFSFITAIKKIFLGNAEFHLYFFIIIIQFYLIFPFILKFVLKFKRHHTKLLILSFIFNLIIISLYYYFANDFDDLRERKIFIFWIFYFILGCVMGINFEYYKKLISKIPLQLYILLFIIIFIELNISYFSDELFKKQITWLRPQILFYSTMCIIIAIKLLDKYNSIKFKNYFFRFIKQLGNYSFGIYLSHILILNILLRLFKLVNVNIDLNNNNILLFLIVLLITFWSVKTLNNLRFVNVFMGDQR